MNNTDKRYRRGYTVDPITALGAFTGRTIKQVRRLRRTVRRRVLLTLDRAAEIKDRAYDRGKEMVDSLLAVENVQMDMDNDTSGYGAQRAGEHSTPPDALRGYDKDGHRRQMDHR